MAPTNFIDICHQTNNNLPLLYIFFSYNLLPWHSPFFSPFHFPATKSSSLYHLPSVVFTFFPSLPCLRSSYYAPLAPPQACLTSLTSGCHCDFKGICISEANLSSLAEHAASHANDEKWAPSSDVLLRRRGKTGGRKRGRRKWWERKKREGIVLS